MFLDMEWRQLASCHNKHADLWFPPLEEDPQNNPYYVIARQVCATCPVWERCLTEGMDEKYGMWGGLTPFERDATRAEAGEVVLSRFRKPVPPNRSLRYLRGHGSWMRFRQGCRCESCTVAQVAQMDQDPVPLNQVPDMVEKDLDIDTLLFHFS